LAKTLFKHSEEDSLASICCGTRTHAASLQMADSGMTGHIVPVRPAVNDHLIMLLLTMRTTDVDGNSIRFAGTFPSDAMLMGCAIKVCTLFFQRRFGGEFAEVGEYQDKFNSMVLAATRDYKVYADTHWSGEAGAERLMREFISYTCAVRNTAPPLCGA